MSTELQAVKWQETRLRDVVTKLVDGSHNPPPKRDLGRPMLSARNIENGRIIFDEFRLIDDDAFAAENARTRITPGDVLLTIVGTIGRSAVVSQGIEHFALQRSVAVLGPMSTVLSKFLSYQLQAPRIQRHFQDSARGTAQKGVYLKTLGETPILLTSLDNQHRIVAEIEKQFSRLDQAVASLQRVKAQLKRYKASVLKAAVEGRLVETEAQRTRRDGRGLETGTELAAQGSANAAGDRKPGAALPYETGEQLLKRILDTRRSQWKGKGKYKEPAAPDASGLPELPEGWVWASGAQLFAWSSGVNLPVKQLEGGDFPVYGGNGVNGWHTHANVIQPTLVIGRVGAGCGNVNVLDREAWVTDNAIYATWVPQECSLSYLGMVFTTANLNSVAAGSGQPFVNQTILNEVAAAVPPLVEQHRIVAEVDRRLSIVREVEAEVDANLKRAQTLRQAVLARAFTGTSS